ncbi:conserved hypothetical protein [Ricinus communis]|uniref:Uncharacterized protein n=1 Tax=Ricinus communis TaxID=3988 RepID=B9STC3_RICCO|nr:conserved hypothetical protein [Ricinus communis]
MQGVTDEEIFDSFNIPPYTLIILEVKSEIEEQGPFLIDQGEVYEQHWNVYPYALLKLFKDEGCNVEKCVRTATEPLIISHFGFDKAITDEILKRYKAILNDYLPNEIL